MGLLSKGKNAAHKGARVYGKAWAKVSPSRYRKQMEWYMALPGGGSNRLYQKLKVLRSGGHTAAVAVRAVGRYAQSDQPPPMPEAPTPDKGGALAAIAKGMAAAIRWEQDLTKFMGKIPFPKMQALTVGDWSIGLPHAHNHPPNLVPPSTVPIPMPSAGPVLKIPILSGAERTKHAGQTAAMCGDMGLAMAPWCGGYVPMFEVFFGSAHVWIEGNRAARVLCDVVKHCTFSTPKPSDPPLGPMVGVSTGGVNHVGIGGVPLPSFFSLALGKVFQALAWAGGKVFRKLTAKRFVDKMIRTKNMGGIPYLPAIRFDKAVSDIERLKFERDLYKIAKSRTGRRTLRRIAKAHKKNGRTLTVGRSGKVGNSAGGIAPGNPRGAGRMNLRTGKPGPAANGIVLHNPGDWPRPKSPGSPSDAVLHHELNHAANAMEGKFVNHNWTPEHGWGKQIDPMTGNPRAPGRWLDFEEFNTTHVDNAYRREMGLPQRKTYTSPVP